MAKRVDVILPPFHDHADVIETGEAIKRGLRAYAFEAAAYPVAARARRCLDGVGGEPMSTLFDQAVEAMRQMPPATQGSTAQAILANGNEPLVIEDEHLPDLLEGLAQLERREGVVGNPRELVAAAFERHRRP